MTVATYGNLALFGDLATITPGSEDRARQLNSYPGVNGLECLDLGQRGAQSRVEGIWIFADLASFQATLLTWLALVDGVPRTLIDTKLMRWPNCLLNPYKLDGSARTSAVTGQIIQRFSGSLTHLTLS